MQLTHPCPQGRQTDGFGPRGFVPGLGDLGFHTGQDWAAGSGTPILAAQSGTVTRKWWDAFANGAGAGGNMVAIRHDNGWETRYAHMLSSSPLSVGQRVKLGQQVGQVGRSGAATGNHLHFELLINGRFVDPIPYIGEPIPEPIAQDEDDDMAKTSGFYYQRKDGAIVCLLINPVSGFCSEFEAYPDYNNAVAQAFDTGAFAQITESHRDVLKRDCEAVRKGL